MNPKCNYECKSIRDCGARNTRGFTCTRNLGHEGDHVACGGAEHDLCVWPQEELKCQRECVDNENEPCESSSPLGNFCTRNLGHEGDHVACGNGKHEVEVWPRRLCGHECPSEPGLLCSRRPGHKGYHSTWKPNPPSYPEFITWGTQQPSGKALFYTTVEKALEAYAHKRHMPRKDIVTLLHEHLMKVYP